MKIKATQEKVLRTLLGPKDFVGKSTAHGYNAPCFEGMVHCFMSFVLMGWDTADGKDRI